MPVLSRHGSRKFASLQSSCIRISTGRSQSERGVGLIEVLVALLVLSFGFLVSANMQTLGMRSNQEAYYQSQAQMLLNDMMDRMRNNRAGLLQGAYDDKSTGSSTRPACYSSGCGAADMATLDLFEWSANFQSLRDETGFVPVLPVANDGSPATGTISDPDANGVYTLSLSWEQVEDGTVTTEAVSVKFIP